MKDKIEQDDVVDGKTRIKGIKKYLTITGSVLFILAMTLLATATTFVSEGGVVTNSANVSEFNNILYVTPGDAADIQNKLNLCPSKGCIIYFPPGVYTLNGPINLTNRDNITLQSSGYSTVLKANFTRDVGMEGLIEFGIKNGLNNIIIDGFYADLRGFPVRFVNAEDGGINNNIVISNNYIIGTNETSINIDANQLQFYNNYITNAFGGITTHGKYIYIHDNIMIANESHPVSELEGIDLGTGSDAIISNNEIRGFKEEGIDSGFQRVIISNNRIYAPINQSGAGAVIRVGGVDSKVINNHIYNFTYGIAAITVHGTAKSSIISGNTINCYNASDTAIEMDANNSIISNNFFENCFAGIREDAGNNNSIFGNYFENVTNPYYVLKSAAFELDNSIMFLKNGKFGINTETPSGKLDVNGPSNFSANGQKTLTINQEGAARAVDIDNRGSAEGLRIDQYGDHSAFSIDQLGESIAINVYHRGIANQAIQARAVGAMNDNEELALFWMSSSSSQADVIRIVNSGTGRGLYIDQNHASGEHALQIDQAGTGNAIQANGVVNVTGRIHAENNITLTSPDGTEFNCGVSDAGSFSCS